jgi:wyosine [tRNA(Phe)-imidazoG37] synthetase (radical SAM superfamily)
VEKGIDVLPLKKGIIYGPVQSRRLGSSLGINLSPTRRKLCSFNCIYCHYGWTERLTMDTTRYREEFPSKEQVLDAVRNALRSSVEIEYITFSGDGEPTLHPDFEEIVRGVRMIRDTESSGTPLAILTNSSTLDDMSVRKGLTQIDLPIFKLDAGTQEVFEALNNPVSGIELEHIVECLCSMERVIIQSIFLKGAVDNTSSENLSAWIAAVGSIKPEVVQMYSTDRPVPKQGIERVEREQLEHIAERTTRESGAKAAIYSLDP